MSQRSITSFFKKIPSVDAEKKKDDEETTYKGCEEIRGSPVKSALDDSSPIKVSNKRKRSRKIESDSEEDEQTKENRTSFTEEPSQKLKSGEQSNGQIVRENEPITACSKESKSTKLPATAKPSKKGSTSNKTPKRRKSSDSSTKPNESPTKDGSASQKGSSNVEEFEDQEAKGSNLGGSKGKKQKTNDADTKKTEVLETEEIKEEIPTQNGAGHELNSPVSKETKSPKSASTPKVSLGSNSNKTPKRKNAGKKSDKAATDARTKITSDANEASCEQENSSSDSVASKAKKQKINEDENVDQDSPDKTDTAEKSPKGIKKEVHSFFSPKSNGSKTTKEENVAYNPAKNNYHPIKDASWKQGEKVPYIALATTLSKIEEIRGRLKIVEILSNYLRSVILLNPPDLLPSVYLCLNQLAPAYEGLELGIAEGILMKAIAQATGRSTAQIKTDAKELGDLGLVAEQSKCSQRMMFTPPPLTVSAVYNKLKEIAKLTGHSVVAKKMDKIQSMFVACKGCEARYLIRSLAGKLRIGLAEQSVLQALAHACSQSPPEQERPATIINQAEGMSTEKFKTIVDKNALILKTTYCECPNYDKIVPVIINHGIAALPDHCHLSPGLPLKPMLAQPTKGVQEVLNRFDGIKFTCEWKYDGERAQIHKTDEGKVSIFSRNQEDNTSKYPDIISRLDSCTKDTVKSFILDSECVAWDLETQKIKPFQILSTRKRKDANESEIKVQVCVFMFDLLFLNGKSLVKEPLAERRALLKEHFKEIPGQWVFAYSLDTNKMEEVQEFLEESVKGNCEGLMVKTLEEEATYEIAKRSRNWLKLKKDYMDGVGDSIDAVVIGGYLGKGKRTGLYGGFLLACYDPENEEYQSLCKIGTGFSDEDFQKHTELLKGHVIDNPRSFYRFDKSHTPDHWFDAVQVWEIKCADLSLSPVHRAAIGIVEPERGISLRFPRFLRIRDDKSVEQATSAQQIVEMYKNQDQIKNQEADSKFNEEDFY